MQLVAGVEDADALGCPLLRGWWCPPCLALQARHSSRGQASVWHYFGRGCFHSPTGLGHSRDVRRLLSTAQVLTLFQSAVSSKGFRICRRDIHPLRSRMPPRRFGHVCGFEDMAGARLRSSGVMVLNLTLMMPAPGCFQSTPVTAATRSGWHGGFPSCPVPKGPRSAP